MLFDLFHRNRARPEPPVDNLDDAKASAQTDPAKYLFPAIQPTEPAMSPKPKAVPPTDAKEPTPADHAEAGLLIFANVFPKLVASYNSSDAADHDSKISALIDEAAGDSDTGKHIAHHLLGQVLAQCEVAGHVTRP